MKMEKAEEHDAFPHEGQSGQVRSVWIWNLGKGEETSPHQHFDGEELFFIISGKGRMTVGEAQAEVNAGQSIFVPACTNHALENVGEKPLRAVSVETFFEIETEVAEKKTVAHIDKVITDLPEKVDDAAAIQSIVSIFDVGGRLSEQIEDAFGLDNVEGVSALEQVERKIMEAVVEITNRYRASSGGTGRRRY